MDEVISVVCKKTVGETRSFHCRRAIRPCTFFCKCKWYRVVSTTSPYISTSNFGCVTLWAHENVIMISKFQNGWRQIQEEVLQSTKSGHSPSTAYDKASTITKTQSGFRLKLLRTTVWKLLHWRSRCGLTATLFLSWGKKTVPRFWEQTRHLRVYLRLCGLFSCSV